MNTPRAVVPAIAAARSPLEIGTNARRTDGRVTQQPGAQRVLRARLGDNGSTKRVVSLWSALQQGRVLGSGEIRALFAACQRDPTPSGVMDAALLVMLYGGGLQRAEVVTLDVLDFDAGSGAVTIRASANNRERRVYATHEAAAAMRRWMVLRLATPGALFVPIDLVRKVLVRDEQMKGESISASFLQRAKQAGIKPFSCQDLRRSFVSRQLEAGVALWTVQQLVGRCSVATALRYDRTSENWKRQSAQILRLPA